MTYYRIKPKYDNAGRNGGSVYVGNELYTQREKEKYRIPEKYTEVVKISKKSIYFFFGSRFAIEMEE